VLTTKVNFKILQSKAIESIRKNNYKCVFQQGVVLTNFSLKYPWVKTDFEKRAEYQKKKAQTKTN
jgi:hypothetical protein